MEASLHAMHTWLDDMQKSGNQMYAIASAFVVGDMQIALGYLGAAEKALWHAIQKSTAPGHESEVVTAHHHLELAMLAHERGDDAKSAKHLQTVAELGHRTTLLDWTYHCSPPSIWQLLTSLESLSFSSFWTTSVSVWLLAKGYNQDAAKKLEEALMSLIHLGSIRH